MCFLLNNLYHITINKTIQFQVVANNPEEALNLANMILNDKNAEEILSEDTSYQIHRIKE